MLYTHTLGNDADDATKIITALMPLAQIGAVGLLNKDALAAPGVIGSLTGKPGALTPQYNMTGADELPAPTPGWMMPALIGGGVLLLGGFFWAMMPPAKKG